MMALFKVVRYTIFIVILGSCINAQSENWAHFNKNNSGLPTNSIRLVVQDKHGVYWIGTCDAGLVRFDGKTWKVYNTSNSKLPHNYVYSIAFDDTQNLWIGTYGGGVAKFDGEKKWTIYNASNSGLPNNWIYSIVVDKKSIIWIGSYSGLARFDGLKWKVYNFQNSLLTSKVTALYVDKNNTKWIGTADSIFQITSDNKWKSEKEFGYVSNDDAAYWITSDLDDRILICYKFGSIVIYDGKEFKIYNTDNSKLPFNGFYSICSDQNGIVWCGNWGFGIVRFDGNNFELFNKSNSQIKDDFIFNIYVDSKNTKWFSTYFGGISLYNENGIKL